jgi:hypothetical protein
VPAEWLAEQFVTFAIPAAISFFLMTIRSWTLAMPIA